MNWQPIATAPKNRFVLVARDSGYITYPWCYEVARFTEGYHDRWDTVGNDAIEPEPTHWCELPTPPEPMRVWPQGEGEVVAVSDKHPTREQYCTSCKRVLLAPDVAVSLCPLCSKPLSDKRNPYVERELGRIATETEGS